MVWFSFYSTYCYAFFPPHKQHVLIFTPDLHLEHSLAAVEPLLIFWHARHLVVDPHLPQTGANVESLALPWHLMQTSLQPVQTDIKWSDELMKYFRKPVVEVLCTNWQCETWWFKLKVLMFLLTWWETV